MAETTKEKRIAEFFYYEVDFDQYVRALGIPYADAQRTLWVTPSQFQLWRDTGRVPVPVWDRAVKLWGDQKIQPKGPHRVPFKAFMLPAKYDTKAVAAPTSPVARFIRPEAKETQVVPPSSPVVPDAAGYVAAIEALGRVIASLSGEKALLVKENFRLQRLNALLTQNGEMAGDLAALDAMNAPVKAPAEITGPVMDTIRQTLKEESLLRQIEERIPFVLAR